MARASLFLPEHEAHTANRVDQLPIKLVVYLAPKPVDVNVDDIVEGGGARFPSKLHQPAFLVKQPLLCAEADIREAQTPERSTAVLVQPFSPCAVSNPFRDRRILAEEVDRIASREYENRCVQSTLSKCGQHLKLITAGKHQVQDHQVEFLGINKKESFFARGGNDDLVFLALQSLTKGACDFRLVFNNKNSRWKPFLPASYAAMRGVAT